MAYLKKTNLFKTIVFSRTAALIIIFTIVFMCYALISIGRKSIEASRARHLAESQASELSQKRQVLSTKLEALNTPSGKEAVLREQFPVVKEGERMVVISDEKSDPTGLSETDDSSKGGFWQFLKNLFN